MKTISQIKIEQFRNLRDITIPVGRRVTAIAGQNGTSKTSLLGMISHVFSFDTSKKMLSGEPFFTKYSEIFRFSFPKYDKPGKHIYSVDFEDGEEIAVISTERNERGTTKNLRLRVGKPKAGLGKVKIPVAYLGMKRLYPFAQENTTRREKSILTPDEIAEYEKLHNEILLMDEEIHSSRIITRNKNYFAPESTNYDHVGISAGQDNIGQIITVILSFRRLKSELGDDYPGGIFLIDELDASLYPAAQMKLVEKLFRISADLDLQIFFTTHSLEVLEEVSKRTRGGDGAVVYLNKASGRIIPTANPELDDLRRALRVLGPSPQPEKLKVNVYVEDVVAKDFADSITDKTLKGSIKYIPTLEFGDGILQKLADANLPDLKSALFLIDGDVPCRAKKVLQLPGSVYPELVIYKHLSSLTEDDPIWSSSDSGYSKQFCFKDCQTGVEKHQVKMWYKNQKRYLGNKLKAIWESWKEANQADVEKFNSKLSSKINSMIEQR